MPTDLTFWAASLGAIVGGFMTLIVWSLLNRLTHSRNVDLAHAQRIIEVETRINEDALALYGIDLQQAGENDEGVTPSERGVTADRVSYVVTIINAQNLRFGRNKMGTAIKSTDLARMFDEDYMQRFFEQKVSREVWRHARRCFRKSLRDNVDKYLEKKYPGEYKNRPMEPL